MEYEPNLYFIFARMPSARDKTFKDYCRFILEFRQDDISYWPYQFDFCKMVLADKSFPRKTYYRRLENYSNAYNNYRNAIEKHIEKKYTSEEAKITFKYLWREYRNFEWINDEYYEKRKKQISQIWNKSNI